MPQYISRDSTVLDEQSRQRTSMSHIDSPLKTRIGTSLRTRDSVGPLLPHDLTSRSLREYLSSVDILVEELGHWEVFRSRKNSLTRRTLRILNIVYPGNQNAKQGHLEGKKEIATQEKIRLAYEWIALRSGPQAAYDYAHEALTLALNSGCGACCVEALNIILISTADINMVRESIATGVEIQKFSDYFDSPQTPIIIATNLSSTLIRAGRPDVACELAAFLLSQILYMGQNIWRLQSN